MGEITIPRHTPGPPQHRHAQHDEGFYFLSGRVRFAVGQDDYDAGAWVMVPPGAPHTFANVSDETAVMLNTYFHDLKAMVDAGQPLSHDSVAAVWAKYGTEPSTEYA
ncbi:cupin domain-containing protein [Streptomyces sp. NPDC007851]|uniref:cupin domain-containing protein n=1 Tax=Streptomyces sp. NPDC007851 TaxID=3155008 RepID=UPI0033DC717B